MDKVENKGLLTAEMAMKIALTARAVNAAGAVIEAIRAAAEQGHVTMDFDKEALTEDQVGVLNNLGYQVHNRLVNDGFGGTKLVGWVVYWSHMHGNVLASAKV